MAMYDSPELLFKHNSDTYTFVFKRPLTTSDHIAVGYNNEAVAIVMKVAEVIESRPSRGNFENVERPFITKVIIEQPKPATHANINL